MFQLNIIAKQESKNMNVNDENELVLYIRRQILLYLHLITASFRI